MQTFLNFELLKIILNPILFPFLYSHNLLSLYNYFFLFGFFYLYLVPKYKNFIIRAKQKSKFNSLYFEVLKITKNKGPLKDSMIFWRFLDFLKNKKDFMCIELNQF